MSTPITYPRSTTIDAIPDEGLLEEIAEEALQAFFLVVCNRMDDLYPEGKTSGDVDPLMSVHVARIARGWVDHHAVNNPVVAKENPWD